MGICKLFIFTVLLSFFSCQKEFNDGKLKIYHLKPNEIMITEDTVGIYGWYSKTRRDFFTINNFDINSERHKVLIDSFIINYIKKDSFLIKNNDVRWSLIFFKYGDEITENTKHKYDTDYTIHNLFAQSKEICYFTFDTRVGYRESSYWLNHKNKKTNKEKRELILKYFENNFTPNK